MALTFDDIKRRSVHSIVENGRELVLIADDGSYWVRDDMTSEEGERAADTLASWLYYALSGATRGSYAARRLYDDGEVMPR